MRRNNLDGQSRPKRFSGLMPAWMPAILLTAGGLAAAVFVAVSPWGGRSSVASESDKAPQPNGFRLTPMSKKTYSKPTDEILRRTLTPMQYEVTQKEATEPPFHNAYWNNHAVGLYVDVATGEPLFSSTDKFDSGTGWPSFIRPVEPGRVVDRRDGSLGMARTEVRSRAGDSHLGHVFDDGPGPTGLRYCINAASIRFVPVDRLEAEGYPEYRVLFSGAPAAAAPAKNGGASPPTPAAVKGGTAPPAPPPAVQIVKGGASSAANVPAKAEGTPTPAAAKAEPESSRRK